MVESVKRSRDARWRPWPAPAATHCVDVLRAAGEVEQQFGARRRAPRSPGPAGCGASAGRWACRRVRRVSRPRSPARRSRSASMRICVVLPQPSIPSKVTKNPRRGSVIDKMEQPSSDLPTLRAWRSDCRAAADRTDDTSPSPGMSRHLCHFPRSRVTPSLRLQQRLGRRPAQRADGLRVGCASSWRNRNWPQISISSGCGVRFSGGRHFTTLQM